MYKQTAILATVFIPWYRPALLQINFISLSMRREFRDPSKKSQLRQFSPANYACPRKSLWLNRIMSVTVSSSPSCYLSRVTPFRNSNIKPIVYDPNFHSTKTAKPPRMKAEGDRCRGPIQTLQSSIIANSVLIYLIIA